MCLMVELTHAWFNAHEEGIRSYWNDAGIKGYDLTTEAVVSSRQVARGAGVTLDRAYIEKFAAGYRTSASQAWE